MLYPDFALVRQALRWARTLGVAVTLLAAGLNFAHAQAPDPLPSWNDTGPKKAIIAFVGKVTTPGTSDFVAPPERIATFDNDGTLWVEQPMYVQMVFALDRVNELAPQHPEWKTKQPFKAVLEKDFKGLATQGEKGLVQLIAATHTGMTTDQFNTIVSAWIAKAHDPRFKKLYTELAYQPMVELLAYLRANGFKTYIVSGGGVEFMRSWTERVYGVPPEQVVGSSGKLKFEMRDGKPALIKLPEIELIDDKEGKPVGIQQRIGRVPIFAFGNSDGDQQMLEWTAAGSGARFMGLVHHTDAVREYAYDRNSSVGKLDTALTEATAKGWTVVDMRNDWRKVFAFQ
jgi:hypothetical protein